MSGGSASEAENGLPTTGKADPVILRVAYDEWKTEYLKNGGDSNLILALHWSKGLSDETTKASGHVKIDMTSGNIAAAVIGLSASEGWDLWLVQNLPETSVLPEQEDTLIKVGTMKPDGKFLKLEAALGSETFASFRPDMAVVTRVGKGPDESRILIATTSLFHSLYWNTYPGQFGVLGHAARAKAKSDERGFFGRILSVLLPSASAQKIEGDPLEVSIENGKRLFFEETFSGNGRTCGTCHPAGNNFTIDPTFISTLDQLDPLFIAENDPNLAGLENPRVMRGTGDILENVDGFQNPGVLRGVPHTLALGLSDRPDSNVQGRGFSNALGWSGDGSPTNETLTILLNPPPSTQTIQHLTTGSLRDFALGAVRQHFPKRLNRVPNVDFRFPSLSELNDMEAFQLSLGRTQELQLDPNLPGVLRLRGALPAQGQVLFRQTFGAAACNNCHFNAGANTGSAPNDINANFNTRVERLPLQPARLIDPTIPIDGGLGGEVNPQGGFGDGTFNTPPLVEAADTPPFFHNNSINTIELAVQFYEFSFSPQQVPPNLVSFQLSQGFGTAQIQAIAAFLRVINALENIRSSIDLETRAQQQSAFKPAVELIELSIADLEDAVEVLSDASLHPTAIRRLREAIQLDQIAMTLTNQADRNAKLQEAICKKRLARADMLLGPQLLCAQIEPVS
ncbi:MAG TPA: hypothetical protein VKA70_19370 [Blastocatellia bacterium]|nr:hypothetical protein [Blastocatellia bacterium]